MLLENKKVAIAGGGPGGLTLARLLQMESVDVKVYERDFNKEVRVQGATLDLHTESGLKALEAAGLMDAFKENYRPGAGKGRVVDKLGKIIYDEHNEPENGDDFGNAWSRPEIDRGPLRNRLLASLASDTVIWDSHLVTMLPAGDGWTLVFKNGTTAYANLVVGANGANSNIRPFVTLVKPFYSGVTIIQGNVENSEAVAPRIHQLLKGGKIYVFAGGKYLHISSKGDGSIDFYICCKVDEHWIQNSGIDFSDKIQVIGWFKNEFQGWDGVWLELFENGGLPLLLRPQYCMPLDESWDTLPNLTLLGDAAHIMPPSGEGVNLAMLDALGLTDCLVGDSFTDIPAAIAAYEKQMLARAAEEAQTSLDMLEWMHSDGAQAKMVEMIVPGH